MTSGAHNENKPVMAVENLQSPVENTAPPKSYVGPVTWTQLREDFGMEVIAEGCTLKGIIVFREEEYWLRGLSKTFRLRDVDGVEQQVTIAANRGVQKKHAREAAAGSHEEVDDEEDDEEPVLTQAEENDLQLGAVVELRSPRLHRFLDGEEGSVVYSAKDLRVVEKASDTTLTLEEKLRMGEAMKAKGNAWMAKKENHRAKTNYQGALNLLNTVTTADALASNTNSTPDADTEEQQKQLHLVEEARVLQSACGSNLMLIAIQEKEWNVAIKSGEEILAHGVRGGVRSKVLYRMALAFEKLGSMEVAMEYALKAKDAAIQAGIQAPEVDTLYQRLVDETTGRRYLGGLRHLAWGQAHHLDGMHPRYGYRAPLLGDPKEAKEMAEVLVDAAVVSSPPSSTASESTEASLATNTKRCSLKPRLLYVCEHTPFTAAEARYMEDVLRVKTVVYLHTGLLPHSRGGALSVSHPLLAFSGFSVPPQVISVSTSSSKSTGLLPMSPEQRVVVSVDVVPLLVPAWFYCVLSALLYVGLSFVAQAVLRFYLSMRYRANTMVQVLQRSPEVLTLISKLLARPENYPVAFCSDFPSAEYGPNDVAFAAWNGYKMALLQEEVSSTCRDSMQTKGTGKQSNTKVWERDIEVARSFLLEK